MTENFDSALSSVSPRLRKILSGLSYEIKNTTYEIRMRSERPLTLIGKYGTVFIFENSTCTGKYSKDCVKVSAEEIKDTFNRVCSYSIHTFQRSINNGYIPMQNGNRAGVCGTAVCDKDNVVNVKDITSLNLRISKQIIGSADDILPIFEESTGGVIIVGTPNSGKTTVLRDLIRQLSSGKSGKYYKVCAIDDRREISAVCDGIVTNDIGITCDILDSYPTAKAIDIAVRTLSPDIIACDEISTEEEVAAITKGVNCGVRFIVTMHAGNYEELLERKQLEELLETRSFAKVILLGTGESIGKIKAVYDSKELINEIYLHRVGGAFMFTDGDKKSQ